MWWNLAQLGVITGGFALSTGGWLAPVGIIGGALLVAPLDLVGHLDSKDRYPIARQGTFLSPSWSCHQYRRCCGPVLVYFVAYYMTSPTQREELTHEPFLDHDS